MCGIAGIHRRGRKQVRLLNRLSDNLMREIESRGTHATGCAAASARGIVRVEKAVLPARKFVGKRKQFSPATKNALLHTRFATVGRRDDPRNAHPVQSGNITAIHNGTIYNADEVFKAFELPRLAEVDSEVIPAIVAHAGWDRAADALDLLEGGAATALINADVPDEVILARLRGYPLIYLVMPEVVVWASTRQAIVGAWIATYGHAPQGSFHELDDYTMVRINGRVGKPERIGTELRRVAKLANVRAPKTKVTITRLMEEIEDVLPPRRPTVSKRSKRQARKARRSAPTPVLMPEAEENVYIQDLMRAGLSREEAEALVWDIEDEWAHVENPHDWRQP